MRKKARTTSTLREELVRARQFDDFTAGVESQTFSLPDCFKTDRRELWPQSQRLLAHARVNQTRRGSQAVPPVGNLGHEETRVDRRGVAWAEGRNGSRQSSLRQML